MILHPHEPHDAAVSGRLNWLRAGVLGANDGIVSTAGLVVGVAGATAATEPVLAAGVAGMIAGAVSMALGEYVSVSSQRDTERALLDQERGELAEFPEQEFEELVALYEAKGLSAATARQVARELSSRNALAAHADVELRLDPDELTSPWQAAAASAVAFTVGSLLPLAAILLASPGVRAAVTFVVVIAALAATGYLSARLGGARPGRAVLRLVAGGAAGMAATYGIGMLVGAAAG